MDVFEENGFRKFANGNIWIKYECIDGVTKPILFATILKSPKKIEILIKDSIGNEIFKADSEDDMRKFITTESREMRINNILNK